MNESPNVQRPNKTKNETGIPGSGVLTEEWNRLQDALDASPDDVELNRRAAQLLAKLERFDEAIAYWQRVEDVDPRAPPAPRQQKKI